MLNVTIDKSTEDAEYPCVMVNAVGTVILLERSGCGVVIKAGTDCYNVGCFSDAWNMKMLYPFYGTVTITSKKVVS